MSNGNNDRVAFHWQEQTKSLPGPKCKKWTPKNAKQPPIQYILFMRSIYPTKLFSILQLYF